MTGAGRPLRFLALLACGWVGARFVLLWPPAVVVVDTLRDAATPRLIAAAILPLVASEKSRVSIALPPRAYRVAVAIRYIEAPLPQAGSVGFGLETVDARRSGPMTPVTASFTAPETAPPRVASPNRPAAIDRWSASLWLIARDRGRATLAPGGSLGGAQVGARLLYRPDIADGRLALFARASRPLEARGAEAAIGVEAQPFVGVPFRVALEQRIALERGAAEGTAISVIGGVSDVPLPYKFRLDAYGQAGIVGLQRRAGFADGAVTIVRPVAETGSARLSLGVGVWGAAQPGVARLDIGPRVEAIVPIARKRVRIGLEYRQRIAGDARPGSGPALVIGTDL